MNRNDFYQQALLAVLPVCATYSLNGLTETIKHREEQLMVGGYPEPAIARRVYEEINRLQSGAFNAAVANAVSLAKAITNAAFQPLPEPARDFVYGRETVQRLIEEALAAREAKQKESAAGARIPKGDAPVVGDPEMPSTFCSEDGQGPAERASYDGVSGCAFGN